MKEENPLSSHAAEAADALTAKQNKVIVLQRMTLALLFVSLFTVALYARTEKRRADLWRAEVIQLQAQRDVLHAGTATNNTANVQAISILMRQLALLQAQQAQRQVQQAQRRIQAQPHAVYYPATLIGEDGSQTSLAGKALQIDLGGERLLEVDLQRREYKGATWLSMWAPARRDDSYFNRVVLHPHCSNFYSLELDRIKVRSDSADVVKTAD